MGVMTAEPHQRLRATSRSAICATMLRPAPQCCASSSTRRCQATCAPGHSDSLSTQHSDLGGARRPARQGTQTHSALSTQTYSALRLRRCQATCPPGQVLILTRSTRGLEDQHVKQCVRAQYMRHLFCMCAVEPNKQASVCGHAPSCSTGGTAPWVRVLCAHAHAVLALPTW